VAVGDPPRGLEPVHVGHAYVEEDEPGIEPVDLRDRVRARPRAADPPEPGRGGDDLARDVQEDRLVVDPEHGDLVRRGVHG
jgi:hypothetical protein